MNENLRSQVLDFLNILTPKVCSLATVSSEGVPHCAVMGYIVLSDLSLVLNTHISTRKWSNLLINPKAALTFGWSLEQCYLQCEGDSELVSGGEMYLKYENLYFAAHPGAVKYKEQGETGTIRVIPSWFRLYDFRVDPTQIQEMILKKNPDVLMSGLCKFT